MTCRHCQQPICRCSRESRIGHRCHGWIHADGLHACDIFAEPEAQPEPGTPPVTEAPARKPEGEVA